MVLLGRGCSASGRLQLHRSSVSCEVVLILQAESTGVLLSGLSITELLLQGLQRQIPPS